MRYPESEAELRKMNTKQLLYHLERARVFAHSYCFRSEPNYAPRECWTCVDDLKEILATREHRQSQRQRIEALRKRDTGQKKRQKSWKNFNEKKS